MTTTPNTAQAGLPAQLPCPFCGGAASIKRDNGDERFNKKWHVGCEPCRISFIREGSNSWASNTKQDIAAEIKAITDWNTRTAQPVQPTRKALSDAEILTIAEKHLIDGLYKRSGVGVLQFAHAIEAVHGIWTQK